MIFLIFDWSRLGSIKISKAAALLVLLTFLWGCSARPYIMVEERSTIATKPVIVHTAGESRPHVIGASISDGYSNSNTYVVRRGDTLYSIAFVNQISVDELMCWNGINDSRFLQIGQTLNLNRPAFLTDCVVAIAEPNEYSATQTSPIPKKAAPTKIKGWSWPIQGKLLESFSAVSRRQGVVIAAAEQTPIKAAADGSVVYSGNALKGYGNLLILNHPDGYLSAYAHTYEILVKEGQAVRAHDVIATSGRDNSNRAGLHFQIRKDGNPVDPLPLLKR